MLISCYKYFEVLNCTVKWPAELNDHSAAFFRESCALFVLEPKQQNARVSRQFIQDAIYSFLGYAVKHMFHFRCQNVASCTGVISVPYRRCT